MYRLKNGQSFEFEFVGRKFLFERVNPYFVKVVSDLKEQMVSIISDEIEIRADFDFYERPYLFKFKDPLSAAPKTVLKFFLKLPLMKKLVLEAGKTDVVVEKYAEEKRKI